MTWMIWGYPRDLGNPDEQLGSILSKAIKVDSNWDVVWSYTSIYYMTMYILYDYTYLYIYIYKCTMANSGYIHHDFAVKIVHHETRHQLLFKPTVDQPICRYRKKQNKTNNSSMFVCTWKIEYLWKFDVYPKISDLIQWFTIIFPSFFP